MTKRFTIEQTTIKDCIVDNTTGEQLDTFDYTERLCEVLNMLHEENEQLKSKLFDFNLELEHSKESVDDAYWELTEIKKENDDLKKGILKDIFADECEVYKKENEQLQSEVSKLTDLLASEIEKNARLLQEINSLKIENMRFKESIKDLNDVLARYEEKELKG